MKIGNLVLGALLGAGAMIALADSASARIVCSRSGDCWHTERREHVPAARFDYHPDDWYFHQRWDSDRDRHWRGYHEGRGYYRGGVWITL